MCLLEAWYLAASHTPLLKSRRWHTSSRRHASRRQCWRNVNKNGGRIKYGPLLSNDVRLDDSWGPPVYIHRTEKKQEKWFPPGAFRRRWRRLPDAFRSTWSPKSGAFPQRWQRPITQFQGPPCPPTNTNSPKSWTLFELADVMTVIRTAPRPLTAQRNLNKLRNAAPTATYTWNFQQHNHRNAVIYFYSRKWAGSRGRPGPQMSSVGLTWQQLIARRFFFSPKYSAGTGCNNVEVPGQPATIFFSATLNDVTPGPRHIPSNGLAASIIPHVKGFGCVSLWPSFEPPTGTSFGAALFFFSICKWGDQYSTNQNVDRGNRWTKSTDNGSLTFILFSFF